MKKIGLIFGSRSSEHEVSCVSAASVYRAIDKEKYEIVPIGISREGEWFLCSSDTAIEEIENGSWQKKASAISAGDLKKYIDFALPILHGAYGEDGTIQGLFEMLDLPYAGCGVLASSVCMDKAVAKELFKAAGIPTCKYLLVDSSDIEGFDPAEVERALGYPAFVKPANAGSSIGITKVKDADGLKAALSAAARYDRRILIEEAIDARELETGVIGNRELTVASVGEIVPSHEFYDYTAKYADDAPSDLFIPAKIPAEVRDQIRDYAAAAYRALDCEGFSRVDFFLCKRTGKVYLNELNTIPGFTSKSMMPLLFADAGMPYPELIERIINLGYERYNAKNRRSTV